MMTKVANADWNMAFNNKPIVLAGLLLNLLNLATCSRVKIGNINVTTSTEVPCNKSECVRGEVDEEGGGSMELVVCLGIAVIASIMACIGYLIIRSTGKSGGYASGGNIPKPLAGDDDF